MIIMKEVFRRHPPHYTGFGVGFFFPEVFALPCISFSFLSEFFPFLLSPSPSKGVLRFTG